MLCARRTGGDGEKFALSLDDGFAAAVSSELDTMQSDLLEAAKARMAAATFEVDSYAEMAEQLADSDGSQAPGFFLVRLITSDCSLRTAPRRRASSWCG